MWPLSFALIPCTTQLSDSHGCHKLAAALFLVFLQDFDVSLMYEDLAQLEIRLMKLIEQQQKDKAAEAARAGGVTASKKAEAATSTHMVRAVAR